VVCALCQCFTKRPSRTGRGLTERRSPWVSSPSRTTPPDRLAAGQCRAGRARGSGTSLPRQQGPVPSAPAMPSAAPRTLLGAAVLVTGGRVFRRDGVTSAAPHRHRANTRSHALGPWQISEHKYSSFPQTNDREFGQNRVSVQFSPSQVSSLHAFGASLPTG